MMYLQTASCEDMPPPLLSFSTCPRARATAQPPSWRDGSPHHLCLLPWPSLPSRWWRPPPARSPSRNTGMLASLNRPPSQHSPFGHHEEKQRHPMTGRAGSAVWKAQVPVRALLI